MAIVILNYRVILIHVHSFPFIFPEKASQYIANSQGFQKKMLRNPSQKQPPRKVVLIRWIISQLLKSRCGSELHSFATSG